MSVSPRSVGANSSAELAMTSEPAHGAGGGWHGGPATHGSNSHRAPGSIGQSADPGRVIKGKTLPGQMGNVRITTQNLEVVNVDADKNLLVIRGAVPGAPGGLVLVKKSVKVKSASARKGAK